ncbi:MAG: NAD(P)-dependent oxidoreductase [Pseudorhodoplanes sp.]|uniref:NAD(P)-dependent oxidoreductase n=1 Tax=Pseudorhodoplanes sp. TaxID=1934341 RepID=UPI003D0BFB3F
MARPLGFVGCGHMGGAMALRLVEAGYPLVVCDPDAAALAPLIEKGATAFETPREVADRAEIVFACLPSQEISKAVACGDDGVAHGKAIRIYIESSTIGQPTVTAIADRLAAANIAVLDMPVSGGPSWAREGKLTTILSGPEHARDAVASILSRLAGRTIVVGDTAGLAQVAKIVNNALSLTAMMITSEAMVTGVKAGVDAAALIEVINAGTGRNSASVDKFPKSVLPRKFAYGGPIGIGLKDMELYIDLGRTTGASTPVGATVADMWPVITEDVGAHSDLTAMVRYFEKIAGVEVRGDGHDDPTQSN